MKEEDIRRAVRERYGSLARTGSIGCGCGCGAGAEDTSPGADSISIGQAIGYSGTELGAVPEGTNLGLGCGNPTSLASLQPGETVLDLGSGAGFDCFLAAKAVGPGGRVIGVDMTPDMLERARRAAREGDYGNVEFRLGEIEALPVADASVDVVISNCVLNLSPSRERVFAEIARVLKPGGRVMISDLISPLPTPGYLLESEEALVGCLPVQQDDYLDGLRRAGLTDVEIVEEKPYPTDLLTADPAVQEFLATHPGEQEAAVQFMASIRSGLIRGWKPR